MRLPVRFAGALAFRRVRRGGGRSSLAAPELAGGGLVAAAARDHPDRAATAPQTTEAAPQPLGYESEVTCFGYIGPRQRAVHRRRSSAPRTSPSRPTSPTDNLLYLDAGDDRGIKVGRRVLDRHARRRSSSTPSRGKDDGPLLRVPRAGPSSSASRAGRRPSGSRYACTDIPMGSFLKPFEPIPIPLGRRSAAAPSPAIRPRARPRDGSSSPATASWRSATDTDVLIDLGMAEGVQPGDHSDDFPLRHRSRLRHPAAGLLLGLHAPAAGGRDSADVSRRPRDSLRGGPVGDGAG